MKRYAPMLLLPVILVLLFGLVQHSSFLAPSASRAVCEPSAAASADTVKLPDALLFDLDATGRSLVVTNPSGESVSLMGLRVQWDLQPKTAHRPDSITRRYSLDALTAGERRLVSLEPFPVGCTEPFVMTVEAMYLDQEGMHYKPVLVRSLQLHSPSPGS